MTKKVKTKQYLCTERLNSSSFMSVEWYSLLLKARDAAIDAGFKKIHPSDIKADLEEEEGESGTSEIVITFYLEGQKQ